MLISETRYKNDLAKNVNLHISQNTELFFLKHSEMCCEHAEKLY